MSGIHADPSSHFHPYECDGRGKCVHCDRRQTFIARGKERHDILDTLEDAKWEIEHDPATCALCDPEYDRQLNEHWKGAPSTP